MRGDLHIHTENSDGIDNLKYIEALVSDRKERIILGVTDHHCLTLKSPIYKKQCIMVPGIEVSAQIQGIVYHFTAYTSQAILSLQTKTILKEIIQGYEKRAKKIYKKLVSAGYELPPFPSIRKKGLPKPVYTYDLAHQVGKLINITQDNEVIRWSKDNSNILKVEEEDFFPEAKVVIKSLKSDGFLVCLAHPGTRFLKGDGDLAAFQAFLANLIEAGLEGLEAFYPKHTEQQTKHFLKLAQDYKLIVTGGSDYHGLGRGPNQPILNLSSSYITSFMKRLNIPC